MTHAETEEMIVQHYSTVECNIIVRKHLYYIQAEEWP